MKRVHRLKHEVLKDFTQILFESNPMRLEPLAGPAEYEAEALSILSRFTEGALHLCPDPTMQREIATGIVRQAFEFWFSDASIESPEKTALLLLQTYINSCPETSVEQTTHEQAIEPVVISEA